MIVYWQYQTMLFEFRKDGLLGDKYIDDEEVENVLNEHGKLGWELVNVTPVQEGLLAFMKKEIRPAAKRVQAAPADIPVIEETVVQPPVATSDYVHVQDQELVSRPEKKRKKNIAKGEDDMIGGIKIS